MSYAFTATVDRYPGEAAWYFVTLPFDVADDIADEHSASRRGFGSVRVTVTIGSTTWQTSLFPSNEAESYLLPVKKAVRVAEGIDDGATVTVELEPAAPEA